MTQKTLDVIQEKIGYKFNEQYLLVQAFTRKSFATENYNWEDNEKLEFVGDKVLDFIVVKKLTNLYGFRAETVSQSLESIQRGEKISEDNLVDEVNFEFVYSEGEMTEIKKQVVQTSFLARAIEALELEKYLLMGKGDIKNNVQNEYITHKLAGKNDYWFHVKNLPGSHTVMLCDGEEPEVTDFTEAAEIAAYFSKGAEGRNVEVDYTLVRNVKKPAGSRPGFVIYHTNWSCVVTPDEKKVAALRIQSK